MVYTPTLSWQFRPKNTFLFFTPTLTVMKRKKWSSSPDLCPARCIYSPSAYSHIFFLSFLPSVRSLRLNVYGSFGRIWRVSNRCHFSTNDDDSENRFDKAFISRLMMLRRLAQMSSSQLLIIRFLSFKTQELISFF